MIPKYIVLVFILGAMVGWAVAYFVLTKEKRIVSNIRREIDYLGLYHDLPQTLYRKTIFPNPMVSDEEVLAAYRWALGYLGKIPKVKLPPKQLAAEVIICERLFGLTSRDAAKALMETKGNLEWLKRLKRSISN